MKRLLRGLLSAGIGTQIAVVLLVSVLLVQGGLAVVFFLDNRSGAQHPGETTGRLAAYIQLLDVTVPEERPALVRKIMQAAPTVVIERVDAKQFQPRTPWPDPHIERLLGPAFANRVFEETTGRDERRQRHLVFKLRDDSYYRLRADMLFRGPPLLNPFKTDIVFAIFTLTLLTLWVGYAVASPLRAFVRAAEGFSASPDTVPLPEKGPVEIRRLAAALNVMQGRIVKMLADRTQFFAAVSHDLRTPITRLRLQAEFIEDKALRERMLRVVAQMDGLVQSVLSFLREGRSGEKAVTIDLSSVLHTIRDECVDVGGEVSVEAPSGFAMRARTGELHRALSNLVENGLKHGTRVAMVLTPDADGKAATLTLCDDGPGVPADQREHLFKPFMRGDAARTSADQGGFGLGLSIAKLIIEGHGGTIALEDAVPHGLKVVVRLPAAKAE